MPEGSSSEAPVMRPGPKELRRRFSGFFSARSSAAFGSTGRPGSTRGPSGPVGAFPLASALAGAFPPVSAPVGAFRSVIASSLPFAPELRLPRHPNAGAARRDGFAEGFARPVESTTREASQPDWVEGAPVDGYSDRRADLCHRLGRAPWV